MFKVSDKVVCIKNFPECEFYSTPNGKPVKGGVYVVDGLTNDPTGTGLLLVGFPCLSLHPLCTDGWHYSFFRKLDEIKEENRLKNHEPKRTLEKVS